MGLNLLKKVLKGGLRFLFKKGNINVKLSSFENESSKGDKITSYGIYVFKNY
jgi:hypothetical protein